MDWAKCFGEFFTNSSGHPGDDGHFLGPTQYKGLIRDLRKNRFSKVVRSHFFDIFLV
jgi:hypothetical protein